MPVRVYIEEAGCDRRRLDLATIRAYLEANDYELVTSPSRADRIIVATCAFKAREEQESVRRVRGLRRYGDSKIVVFGCLPDVAGERHPELAHVPFVPPRAIGSIVDHFPATETAFAEVRPAPFPDPRGLTVTRVLRRLETGLVPWQEAFVSARRSFSSVRGGDADRPYSLFVCRGCVGLCAYCGIRRAIGPVRSRSVEEVRGELVLALAEGHRSFRILGDDPGCFGVDRSETLPDLVSALFETAQTFCEADSAGGDEPRFSIREIHPVWLIKYASTLASLPDIRFLHQVLCPVQSGSDRVLAMMQREHSTAELLMAIRELRSSCPTLSFQTQVMVGFPGESEEDYEATVAFVREAGFDSVVVFPYDDKPGTPSSGLDDKTDPEVIDRRLRGAVRSLRRAGIEALYSCED